MLDHVTIRVSDREASRRFYNTLLGEPTHSTDWFDEWKDFSLTQADGEHPVTRHLHVALAAPSQEDVDAFWQRGVEAGYRSDGEPGPGRSTRPTTTAASCSTRTATASRRCTGRGGPKRGRPSTT